MEDTLVERPWVGKSVNSTQPAGGLAGGVGLGAAVGLGVAVVGLGVTCGLIVGSGLKLGSGLKVGSGLIVTPGEGEISADGLGWAAAVGEPAGSGLIGGDSRPLANVSMMNSTRTNPPSSSAKIGARARQLLLLIKQ